jgi:hypothetical protein
MYVQMGQVTQLAIGDAALFQSFRLKVLFASAK